LPTKSSRHLVAPELDALIDVFLPMDFSQGIGPVREGLAGREATPLPPALAVVNCEERFLPVPGGAPDVRVLLYTPPGEAKGLRPVVLYFHGGGFVIGNADMGDVQMRQMVLDIGCVAVSVDYRLAPETPWPGALNDNYAALCWVAESSAELRVDPARIAVLGESAGAGHAAALAIHARNKGGPAICFQLIDFPMLDDRTVISPDPHPFTGEFVWTPAQNHFGWKSLLGVEPGSYGVDETAAPARAAELSDLPPAFISIGTLDIFLEESLEYVRRLTRAGVPAELHVIPGAYHGSFIAADAPQSKMANELRLNALARAFDVNRG